MTLFRRLLLTLAPLVWLQPAFAQDTSTLPSLRPAQTDKLNVLLIAVDDLNTALGCYGHPWAKSPNIDRLAQSGVRFDGAYCQYPLCSPSRTSLMTGLRPDTTRIWDNGTHFRKNMPDIVTLPQYFQRHGYFAARVGKIYHYGVPGEIGTSGLDDPPSWNEFINPRGCEKDEEDKVINYTPGRGLGASLSWYVSGGSADDQTDGRVATETIGLLKAHKDEPFFIAAGFYRPHVPCVAPAQFFDLHPLAGISLPQEPSEHMAGIPQIAFWTQPANYGLPAQPLRTFLRAYLSAVSFVDGQVGRVLDALRGLGLADRTVVVLFGDHGWMLGEHGQWQKQALFEPSARVPFIIAVPGTTQAGKVCAQPVELLDIYPTLADVCGLGQPDSVEGLSLKPQLNAPATPRSRPAYTQVQRREAKRRIMGYSVRTPRYRYTEWGGGEEGIELYDYQQDPHEWSNLATDPQHAETRRELKAALSAASRPAP